MKTLIFLTIIIFAVIIAFFYFFSFKPSPTGVYHCVCNVPGYGEKEALITIQISGEDWGARILYPTNITLNVFGNSVPCSCRTA